MFDTRHRFAYCEEDPCPSNHNCKNIPSIQLEKYSEYTTSKNKRECVQREINQFL